MSANLRVVTEDNSAKRSGPLDHKFISALLPTSRDENYYDTLGLYLTVSTKGRKWWRLKYVLHGKEKRMGLGTFPEVSLKEARQRRDEARLYARQGKDPKTHVSFRDSNISAGSTSFESVARKFIDTRKHAWTSDYKDKLQRSLEVDVFPEIGHILISAVIRPSHLQIDECGKIPKELSPLRTQSRLEEI